MTFFLPVFTVVLMWCKGPVLQVKIGIDALLLF